LLAIYFVYYIRVQGQLLQRKQLCIGSEPGYFLSPQPIRSSYRSTHETTRGHAYKLFVHHSRVDIRKHFL